VVQVTTAVGSVTHYQPVELFLELRSWPDSHRWRCQAGILTHPVPDALLGTKGFFELFTITYNARAGTLDIDPSGPLPV
jgi:hypothetical protein